MTESIVFQTAPTPAEKPVETPTPTTERPAWLPENFETPEAFAASYKELQAKFTQTNQQKEAPVETPEQKAAREAAETPEQKATREAAEKAATDAAAEQAAKDAAAKAGVDMPSLEAKFLKDGKLEDSDYADLEAKGFKREDVDGFIAYRQSQAAKVLEPVGGKEGFDRLATWAKGGGYNAEQLKAYNDAVDSGDTGRTSQALAALKAAYDKVHGVVPNLLVPTGGTPVAGAYASMAEYLADVNTPKYKSDPAERARVIAKLGRSNI